MFKLLRFRFGILKLKLDALTTLSEERDNNMRENNNSEQKKKIKLRF